MSTKGERLAKVMARAGFCSRRDAEALIFQGLVKVNQKEVLTPATFVEAGDRIECRGQLIGAPEPTRLWLYHKPAGLVTTHRDPKGRPTVFERLPEHLGRVISVGRLDLTSEGLLLLTNDGALSRFLEHPKTGWARVYRVRAYGRLEAGMIDKLAEGVSVDGYRYGPIHVSIERNEQSNLWLKAKLHEGKNREVRKAFLAVGLEVNRLIRVSYGPFQLGDLARGDIRPVKTRVLAEQLGAVHINELGLRLPDAADEARFRMAAGKKVMPDKTNARSRAPKSGVSVKTVKNSKAKVRTGRAFLK